MILILIGDFNAGVEQKVYCRGVAGRYTVHDGDNGMMICNLAIEIYMIISTKFGHRGNTK